MDEFLSIALKVAIVWGLVLGLIVYSLIVGYTYDKTPNSYHPAIPFAAVGLLGSLVLLVIAGGYIFLLALLITSMSTAFMASLCRHGPDRRSQLYELLKEER